MKFHSWAPEVLVSGEWTRNSLRFATEAEAKRSAFQLRSQALNRRAA